MIIYQYKNHDVFFAVIERHIPRPDGRRSDILYTRFNLRENTKNTCLDPHHIFFRDYEECEDKHFGDMIKLMML